MEKTREQTLKNQCESLPLISWRTGHNSLIKVSLHEGKVDRIFGGLRPSRKNDGEPKFYILTKMMFTWIPLVICGSSELVLIKIINETNRESMGCEVVLLSGKPTSFSLSGRFLFSDITPFPLAVSLVSMGGTSIPKLGVMKVRVFFQGIDSDEIQGRENSLKITLDDKHRGVGVKDYSMCFYKNDLYNGIDSNLSDIIKKASMAANHLHLPEDKALISNPSNIIKLLLTNNRSYKEVLSKEINRLISTVPKFGEATTLSNGIKEKLSETTTEAVEDSIGLIMDYFGI
ncbi:TPA_asm: P3 [Agave tequilana virus 1]|uniref:P3 n=1 Tax=Agave tequilana virus 1 TaxID=2793719 RepID=A0A8D9PGW9_9RHAB|nr:P3 [Agave tequilana virus 1]DAF42280.1 TPA_asm: P3 [Agave tequilana virus 1]